MKDDRVGDPLGTKLVLELDPAHLRRLYVDDEARCLADIWGESRNSQAQAKYAHDIDNGNEGPAATILPMIGALPPRAARRNTLVLSGRLVKTYLGLERVQTGVHAQRLGHE